jgi:O-antigen ligase
VLNLSAAPTHQRRALAIPSIGTIGAILTLAIFIALAPLSWLFLLLATTVATLLALIFPWLAWLGLAFALPIASGLRLGPASATDLLFATALTLWCASTISQRRTPNASRLPVWAVAIYLLILYLSSLGAFNLGEALTEMVKWVEFGCLLLIVPMALPANKVHWLVALLLAAAALQGIYGLYQFLFRIGPEWFLIQGRFMRASGVFGQPNPFGAYLGLSLPVAFSLTLWGVTSLLQKRTLSTLMWTIFYLVATLSIGVGLVASWSRGAWLGAVGGMVVVLLFFDRRTAIALGFGILALAITALVGALNPNWIPSAISARIGNIPATLGFIDVLSTEVNDDNFAIIERVAHWVAALRMWEQSPWLGVGPGNYATAYASVALPQWREALGHAHNIYLNVLGETGLLGLGAFLLLWSSLIGWLLQQMHKTAQRVRSSHSWSRALVVGVLGIVAHLAIHSFFDNLFVQGMYLHIAFWLAAVAVSVSNLSNTPGAMQESSFFFGLASLGSASRMSESDKSRC